MFIGKKEIHIGHLGGKIKRVFRVEAGNFILFEIELKGRH